MDGGGWRTDENSAVPDGWFGPSNSQEPESMPWGYRRHQYHSLGTCLGILYGVIRTTTFKVHVAHLDGRRLCNTLTSDWLSFNVLIHA